MDTFSPSQRSLNMSRIRSKGNATTELRFIAILRKFKITGWRRGSPLPGKPDFVFLSGRIVIFVDGDFWHGNPKRYRVPETNQNYWREKIERNKKRDRKITRELKRRGWKVLRFWESSLRNEHVIAKRMKMSLSDNASLCRSKRSESPGRYNRIEGTQKQKNSRKQ
jgi:DNA mismatch endonuclease (patch repair protein)